MLNRKTRLLSIGLALTFTLAFVSKVAGASLLGATMPKQTAASSKPAVTNLAQLIRTLRSRGNKVARKERVEQPFLSVKGQIIKIDDQDVQVFEYRTAHAAQLDANKISPTGSSTVTRMLMWIAPPHFFRAGRLIVLYVGEDRSVLQVLVDILGPQFAGK